MKVNIHVRFDGEDPEKLGRQWGKLYERVNKHIQQARYRRDVEGAPDSDIGVSGNYEKFGDLSKHGEEPDPLESA